MYISSEASKIRQKEAQKARDNRAEIVYALSQGEITRRDLFKWGILTVTGALALKNGLSPFARSAYAAIPTGTPRSPLFGAQKFNQRMPRLALQTPVPLTKDPTTGNAVFPSAMGERDARRLSYHTDFVSPADTPDFTNPLTNRGPIEGRPPGEVFAHQRWDEFFPKVGYVMSLGRVAPNTTRFHQNFPYQDPESVWTLGTGKNVPGTLPLPLFKGRYGEPILARIYNNLPDDTTQNGGFGRNETQLHFHNAHNGAESDGAANTHHFPGTFYDYRWSTTLARRDNPLYAQATERRASGPLDNGDVLNVPGDFREIQGSMWIHDHRFFFTAQNVYKGNGGAVNYYSGPDRGSELPNSGANVNLRLPSGNRLSWGNIDFDVNLVISDAATRPNGQYFFDIFNTEGFLGDIPLVNFAYAPYFEVLKRKYRFRILPYSMSRFWKLALFTVNGQPVPIKQIANDGNLLLSPLAQTALGIQSVGERFDIIVDFSTFAVGSKIRMANLLRMRDDGNGPKEALSYADALKRSKNEDPVLGDIMEFRVVGSVQSVDDPTHTHTTANACGTNDKSQVPNILTEQIPIVAPVRTRVVEFGRHLPGDSRGPDGQCVPECQSEDSVFPWSIQINGEAAHSLNANRVSMVIPKPGEVEHWTYINGGGGWDHPIHLHFEEGVTMKRNNATPPANENLVRKDVWRLGDGGRVQFQVQFGEFGGSYVNHCHNTVHEDFAMTQRIQLRNGIDGSPQNVITQTPNPTRDGIQWTTPEVLPEGVPPPYTVG